MFSVTLMHQDGGIEPLAVRSVKSEMVPPARRDEPGSYRYLIEVEAPTRIVGYRKALAETIIWHAVADKVPDADTTVLVCAPKSDEPIWLGFYDGVYWFAVGGEDYGEDEKSQVTHWAELPRGPA